MCGCNHPPKLTSPSKLRDHLKKKPRLLLASPNLHLGQPSASSAEAGWGRSGSPDINYQVRIFFKLQGMALGDKRLGGTGEGGQGRLLLRWGGGAQRRTG